MVYRKYIKSENRDRFLKKNKILKDAYMDGLNSLDYFVSYIRYDYLITVEFEKSSKIGKTFQVVKHNLKNLFFVYKIKETSKKCKITLSFADYMKFGILHNLFHAFGFDKRRLERVKWLLRYDVIRSADSRIECSDEAKQYVVDPEYFIYAYKLEHPKCDVKKFIDDLKKEIKEKKVVRVLNYMENDRFEEMLYYALHYKQNAMLLFDYYFDHKIGYLVGKAKLPFLHAGTYINVLHFLDLEKSEFTNGTLGLTALMDYDNDLFEKNRKKKGTYGYKSDYILNLQEKQNEIRKEFLRKSELGELTQDIEQDFEKNMKDLDERIIRLSLELRFHMFDIEERKFDIPEDFDKLFQDIGEAITKTSNVELKIMIKDGIPKYMTNKFKDQNLGKYEELKDYASLGGDIGFQYYKGLKQGVKGSKRYNYKKDKDKKKGVDI